MRTVTEDPLGIAVVDKPSEWTSHDVVAKCRGIFGTRKVGHSGTLDPMATGVLVLGVGRATKLLTFLSGLPKTYVAEIRFGVETDSLDADGVVTASYPDMDMPTQSSLDAAAAELTGDIQQTPPMVSALKVDGKRLHELAREGKTVERKPRPVTVSRFELAPTDDPLTWSAGIDCSSGTYVRVLAADVGRALGGGAHLSALRTTAVGPFTLSDAAPMESAEILPPKIINRVMSELEVTDEIASFVMNGRVLTREQLRLGSVDSGPWAVTHSGKLLAVYQAHRADTAKPAFVLGGR